jgi:hypothetical protein
LLCSSEGYAISLFPRDPGHILAEAIGTDGIGIAEFDFGSALNFPTDGPVFDLPDGFSVNSVDAEVVDNLFVGTPPIFVPEPNAALMMAVGAGVLTLLQRARRRA